MSKRSACLSLPTTVPPLGGTLLVVGDIMLDIFTYGECSRISPEATIPVLRVLEDVRMLGGAGNVARNIASLGGKAFLLAPIGDDAEGDALRTLVAAEPLIDGHLVRCPGRTTTAKHRLVARSQQMLRVDREQPTPLHDAEEAAMIDHAVALLPRVDAVILSDYAKGALTPRVVERVIAAARAAGKPILVDPKRRDLRLYAGATCLKPNLHELADAVGFTVDTDDAIVAAARIVLAQTNADVLVATRSDKGMSLVTGDRVLHLPAKRRSVFDVSGAGDTVIAAIGLAIAAGVDWDDAARLANGAAGIAVAKSGTATCSIEELEREVAEAQLGLGAKLATATQAAGLSSRWRQDGLRVGFTNGCFDLLHPGHVALLEAARAACDRLVVGLNSDESVRRLKGSERPLQNQASRAAVLAALASVDSVVVFEDDTPLELIRMLRPAVLVKGADYTIETVVGADLVRADGGTVHLVDLVDGQSTTRIVARLR